MSRGKKRVIKNRMTRKFKREVIQYIMNHLWKGEYPDLTKVQIRRVFSHGYQMLRERKAK